MKLLLQGKTVRKISTSFKHCIKIKKKKETSDLTVCLQGLKIPLTWKSV